jgi:hypothetical protein
VLAEAQKQLQAEICDLIDDEIGNALMDHVKKNKK